MTAQVHYLENVLVPQGRRLVAIEEPLTVRELAPHSWVRPFIAILDGEPVLRADWELVIEDGQSLAFIDVSALPQDTGGGGSDPLRTVLMIAVLVMAPQIGALMGPGMFGAGVFGMSAAAWTTVAAVTGMALVNAVIPAPKLPSTMQLPTPSPTYSVGLQGNSARLESAIPEQFGRMKAYLDFAAIPYQEYAGNEQYVYQLMAVGRGFYNIEGIYIEDTLASTFTEVTTQIVEPYQIPGLFPINVVTSTEVSGQALTCINVTAYSQAGTASVSCTSVGHGLAVGNEIYFTPASGATPADTYTITSTPTADTFVFQSSSRTTSGTGSAALWVGGFIANASGTSVTDIGMDLVMPKGVFYANDNGSLAAMTITVLYECRTVDLVGSPTSAYATMGTVVFTKASNTPQRTSNSYARTGRVQVRARRVDLENTASRVGHSVIWTSMRAYLPMNGTYGDVTLIAMKMRVTNNLSAQAARKINVIATRKLPAWNGSAWDYTTAVSATPPTRSIAWALAYTAKQAGLTDAQIDLASLLTLDTIWTTRGDYFDGRFDNFLSFWEAITKIASAGRTKPYMQGGVLRFVRDQAASIPVALYSMRNIIKGSFSIDYLMPTEDSSNIVKAGYFDNTTWAPASVQTPKIGSNADRITKIDLFGVTVRAQAYREALYHAAANVYRRRIIKFRTEMDGFVPSFGDLIAVQHDMPGWGQGGEVTDWDSGTRTLTLSEAPVWGSGTHYIALRRRDGSVEGPYAVTAGGATNQLVLAVTPSSTPYTGQTEERTHYSFGWAETYRQRARVLAVRPSSLYQVEIECVNEDDNVHTADTGASPTVLVTSQLAGFQNAPVVTGLVVTAAYTARHLVYASWQPAAWADYYTVQLSPDNVNWTTVVANTTDTSFIGKSTNEATSYIRVAATGLARGPWALATYTVAPLADVGGMTYTVSAAGILLSWSKPLDADYADTTIKVGSSWASGTELYTGSATSYLWPRPGTGTYTVWAKHNDFSGVSSSTEQSITVIYTESSMDTSSITLTNSGTLTGAGGGTIDLGSISGALTNNQLDDGTIGSTKFLLASSSGSNKWLDPNFLDPNAWLLCNWGTFPLQGSPSDGISGTTTLRSQTGGPSSAYGKYRIQVTKGKYYKVSAKVRSVGANGTLYICVDAYSTKGSGGYNQVSGSVNNVTVTASWAEYALTWLATTSWASPMVLVNYGGTAGYMEAQDIRIEELVTGDLIVDGTIKATKIDTRGLDIKDAAGNVILAAGTGLDFYGRFNSTTTTGLPAAGSVLINAAGVDIKGNTVTKVSSLPGWDASFYSKDGYAGGAYVSFVPATTTGGVVIGLSTNPTASLSYSSIAYGWQASPIGTLYWQEGVSAAKLGNYAAGDVLAISYDGVTVRYIKNGAVMRTVTIAITDPLYADSSFYYANSTATNIVFGPMTSNVWDAVGGVGKPSNYSTADVFLVNGAGMTIVGNTVTKTGGLANNWDSGFYSQDGFQNGAFVSFVPQQNNAYLMIGLNQDPTTNNEYWSIDYAIECEPGGVIRCWLSGVDSGSLGSYAVGDVLAITADGSYVRFFRNGTQVGSAIAAATTGQLFADSSFYTTGAKVSNIQFGPMTSNAWGAIGGSGKPADNATVNQSDAVTNAGIASAATTALWSNVTGSGRPADYATANQSDVTTNAAIAAKLARSGSDVLSGQVQLASAYAMWFGDSGSPGGATGVYIGNSGIVGRKAGVNTFVLDNSGNATFGGTLTAATGSFAGAITGGSLNINNNAVIDSVGNAAFNGAILTGRNLVIASGDQAMAGCVTVEGYYMINTGIPIESWSGENVPYTAMAGSYGTWVSNDNNFTIDRWGFTCKVIPWTVWTGQSYMWIAARLSSTGMIPSTGAGIRWKLYKVS